LTFALAIAFYKRYFTKVKIKSLNQLIGIKRNDLSRNIKRKSCWVKPAAFTTKYCIKMREKI